MARAATTTDAFNAVAEPRRRQILDVLAGGERSVTDLVARLDLSQPLVSKHLRVLREVGLVQVRDSGRQRVYRLDAGPLRSIADWLRPFERAMSERFDLMDDVIQELKAQEADDGDHDQLREGDPSD
jgi:DNA-binding transcriptional ArsR family regulator